MTDTATKIPIAGAIRVEDTGLIPITSDVPVISPIPEGGGAGVSVAGIPPNMTITIDPSTIVTLNFI